MNSAGSVGEKGTSAKRTGPLSAWAESDKRLGVSECKKVIASASVTL